MSSSQLDRAGALPGPDWLRDRRLAAAAWADATPAPSAEEEIWRYSRIGELDLEEFTPAAEPGDGAPAGDDELVAVDDAAVRVEIVDGHVVAVDLGPEAETAGVEVGLAADADADPGLIGAATAEPLDRFVAVNDATAPTPLLVRIPAGASLSGPILVRSTVITDGVLALPRIVVEAGPGCRATVVEAQRSGPVRSLIVPVTELLVRPDAELDYVAVQHLEPTVWQLASLVAAVEEDAHLVVSAVALGGDYARLRIDTRILGERASADVQSVYHGHGEAMLDFRTVQDHLAPHTRSDLLFKGAVGGRSHSVYTGNIRIAKDARDVEAFQTNRNVKLSEDAWAESVPNLEIENNDVRCSHASAIGPIDPQHRYYLESRGVPPEVAERLVVLGFLDEVLDRLPVPSIAAAVHDELASRLVEELPGDSDRAAGDRDAGSRR